MGKIKFTIEENQHKYCGTCGEKTIPIRSKGYDNDTGRPYAELRCINEACERGQITNCEQSKKGHEFDSNFLCKVKSECNKCPFNQYNYYD